MKVLVLGASGLLGHTLAPLLRERGHDVQTHSRSGGAQYLANLNNQSDTEELLRSIAPEVIVNLVGLTDVDQCERRPNQAYLSNVQTVEYITAWIGRERYPSHLVHISTDQVYDGESPHAETGVTLTNYYAFSKYSGEMAAAKVPSTILRTNFFGRSLCPNRSSLTDWLFQSLSNSEPIEVFDDVFFSPLSMRTLSDLIDLIIRANLIGVFNLGSRAGISKADFAFAFANELGLSDRAMKRISVDKKLSFTAYRPRDMRMDCSKIEGQLGIKLPLLRDELIRVAKEYHERT